MMTNQTCRAIRRCVLSGLFLGVALAPLTASAQEAPYDRDGDPSVYPIEIEPHFTFGAENVYGASGFGAGLRLSIPVVASLLANTPDNLAISFGGDVVHYDNCYFSDRCGADYVMFPVAAQWNIFVARRVSLLVEGGVFVYKGFFDGCGPGDGPGCVSPSDFGILPTVAIGARIHIGRNASFTARLGYPTVTLGVSFL
jgi:hypothetical protein